MAKSKRSGEIFPLTPTHFRSMSYAINMNFLEDDIRLRLLKQEIARVLQAPGPHETLQHSRSVQRCAPPIVFFSLFK